MPEYQQVVKSGVRVDGLHGTANRPHFRVANREDTLLDYAKYVTGRCTHRNVKYFQLFDVADDVIAQELPVVKEVYDAKPFQPTYLSALDRWSKHSVFRLVFGDKKKGGWYETGVVTGENSVMFRHAEKTAKWSVYSNCGRHVDHDSAVDLASTDTSDLKKVADSAIMLTLHLMQLIMDRPHQFEMAKQAQKGSAKLLGFSSTVTISLSKPVIIAEPNPLNKGTGSPMPFYDYAGHWMVAERGKAKRGCKHEPTLFDGEHAICNWCGNLLVWREAGHRGDVNIQRRTTYRVVP